MSNEPDNKKLPRPWSKEDVARMVHMKEVEKRRWTYIDNELGRASGGSYVKYMAITSGRRLSEMRVESGRIHLSPEQLAARRAREDAANRKTLTATFFGDPPPGYSALDRRQSP